MYEKIVKQKKCSRNTASFFECSLMADLHSNAPRPAYMCGESSSLSRLVLYLTALLVSLAACAFVLQWYGGLLYPDVDVYSFKEMDFPERAIASTDCADILGRSKKPSFPYYRNWNFSWGPGQSHNPLKICITTTTSAGLEQILPWIFYHKIIGITQFFLFVEGIAASHNVAMVLESIPDVKLIYRTKELDEQQATSRVWNESRWMEPFLYKPCNNELYVKQNLNMDVAAGMAKEAGMDWIFHIDTDELLHPAGTRNYSIQELLLEVPQNVDAVKVPNYESCVERDDIKEPFTEVSMFKKNIKHILEDMFDKHNEDVARGNPRPFLGYENWKSCARVQDGLKPGGGHEWTNDKDDFFHSVFEEAAILHYTYTKFSDLTSRRNRCRCKPTIEDLERCFMLEFDKEAFIIASTSTEEEMLEWYREHVVWFDTELKAELLRDGILERIYDPMVIVQGLKESGIFADVIASAWEKQQNQKSSS